MLRTRIHRLLRMESWFPHGPLALAVCLVGFAELLPSLGSLQHLISVASAPAREIAGLLRGFDALAIRGLSRGLIGALLVLLALGLLWRSRLAWVLTLLMTTATVAIQFTPLFEIHPVILGYSGVLLLLLYGARRNFQRTHLATGTLFALVGVLLTMGYGVLGSYALGKEFGPPITDFASALYFTLVTMSTVGYGDITPHTSDARLFTSSLILFGLVVFATSLTAIMGPLINRHVMSLLEPRKKAMKRKDHIIIVGDTPLARNAVKASRQRGIQVAVIWSRRPPEGVEISEDLIVGDGSDVDVLGRADIQDARAVLALGEDDSDNAFVVLAAKEANERVHTLVAVSDADNMGRVRHVRPDVVLALPIIGGELLAMALSGEEIQADALLDQLFHQLS